MGSHTHINTAYVSYRETVWANFEKELLASVDRRQLVVTTHLISLSVISPVGSSTAPNSSVAFEISNITRDVAHTMDRYWKAWFVPEPAMSREKS